MNFDYIVVGAGSAGCLVTNRLIQAGHTVLLLEAGGSDKNFWLHLPIGFFKTMMNPKFSRHFDTDPKIGKAHV